MNLVANFDNFLYITESRVPRIRLKITVSKMDLIRDNYQSSDDEEIEVIVIEDDPEPVPIPFELLTPREKKEVFKQELVAFPEIKLEKYRCNW